ncbi:MAG: hypothetical protein ABI193_14930 [Minicystis sp.]
MTGAVDVQETLSVFSELALSKLTHVLGDERGRRVFHETLIRSGLTDLRTADDLFAFAQHLSRSTGFEAAVGGLLSVAALLRGAVGCRS